MGNAPADVLVTHGKIAVQPVGRRTRPMKNHFLGLFADDGIIDISDDFAPGFRLGVMSIDIGDKDVIEIPLIRLLSGLGKYVS